MAKTYNINGNKHNNEYIKRQLKIVVYGGTLPRYVARNNSPSITVPLLSLITCFNNRFDNLESFHCKVVHKNSFVEVPHYS